MRPSGDYAKGSNHRGQFTSLGGVGVAELSPSTLSNDCFEELEWNCFMVHNASFIEHDWECDVLALKSLRFAPYS